VEIRAYVLPGGNRRWPHRAPCAASCRPRRCGVGHGYAPGSWWFRRRQLPVGFKSLLAAAAGADEDSLDRWRTAIVCAVHF